MASVTCGLTVQNGDLKIKVMFFCNYVFFLFKADVLVNTICCDTNNLAEAGMLSAAFASAGGPQLCKV